ncbi:MAG: VOC family protein [Pseudomonadota bacterium]
MTFRPKDFAVWMEIPVRDLEKSVAFYNAVFEIDLQIDATGPNPMATFVPADPKTGVAGHLYPGEPAKAGTGPTVHLAAPGGLEAAMARVTESGGEVVSDIISIPAGKFVYCLDPDGNSIGLFNYG